MPSRVTNNANTQSFQLQTTLHCVLTLGLVLSPCRNTENVRSALPLSAHLESEFRRTAPNQLSLFHCLRTCRQTDFRIYFARLSDSARIRPRSRTHFPATSVVIYRWFWYIASRFDQVRNIELWVSTRKTLEGFVLCRTRSFVLPLCGHGQRSSMKVDIQESIRFSFWIRPGITTNPASFEPFWRVVRRH